MRSQLAAEDLAVVVAQGEDPVDAEDAGEGARGRRRRRESLAPSSFVQHTSSSGRVVRTRCAVQRAEDLEAGPHADDAVVLAARDLGVEVAAHHEHRRQAVVAAGPAREDVPDPVHRHRAAGFSSAPGDEEIAHLLVGVGQRQAPRPAGLAGADLARAHDRAPESAGRRSRSRCRVFIMRPSCPTLGRRELRRSVHRPHLPADRGALVRGWRPLPESDAGAGTFGATRIDGSRRSVWRYAEALHVDVEHAVSWAKGGRRSCPATGTARRSLFKLEFMMPTGSFKDRGMTVMVTYLRSRGIERVLEDSSGNAGASLSAYAAAAGTGLPHPRARDRLVSEDRPDRRARCRRRHHQGLAAGRGGRARWPSRDLLREPQLAAASSSEGHRRRSPTRCGSSSASRRPTTSSCRSATAATWSAPTAASTSCCATARSSACRGCFGVQAARCAPYRRRFERAARQARATPIGPTVAEGIATAQPTRVTEVLRAVRESDGESWPWRRRRSSRPCASLARRGLYVEPTSAVAAAGLSRLLASGAIRRHETTVLVLTGSGLKASATIGAAPEALPANRVTAATRPSRRWPDRGSSWPRRPA